MPNLGFNLRDQSSGQLSTATNGILSSEENSSNKKNIRREKKMKIDF